MKDPLHQLSLVVAVLGLLILLPDAPARRRDPAWNALVAVFALSAASFLISLTPVWTALDHALGTVSVAVPLAQGCVVALLACQGVVFTYWGSPPDHARRTARLWLLAGLAVVVGLFTLFDLLTPSQQRPADFTVYYVHDQVYAAYLTLYITAYTLGELILARGCWTLGRRSPRTPVRTGLIMVAIGAVITLGYSAVRIANVTAATLFDTTLAARWEDIAWICGDLGSILTLAGWLIPTLTDRAQRIRYRIRLRRIHAQLHPLWQALHDAAPEITLEADSSDRAQRRITFRLYRRVVEIHDGRLLLRPYLDAAVRQTSTAHHRAEGLRGDNLLAAVTADQILAALTARAASNAPPPGALADFADTDRTSSGHPMEDIRALLAVARHIPPTPTRQPEPERIHAP